MNSKMRKKEKVREEWEQERERKKNLTFWTLAYMKCYLRNFQGRIDKNCSRKAILFVPPWKMPSIFMNLQHRSCILGNVDIGILASSRWSIWGLFTTCGEKRGLGPTHPSKRSSPAESSSISVSACARARACVCIGWGERETDRHQGCFLRPLLKGRRFGPVCLSYGRSRHSWKNK